MDRAKAKSMTRKVQAAAGGLLLLGAAAALIPLSITKAESTEAAPPPAPAPKPPETPKVEIDTTILATALNTISGPVKNQPVVQQPGADTAPQPRAKEGLEAWRYLGAIMSGAYKRAIVSVGPAGEEQQHLLAEGQTISLDPPSTPPEQRNPENNVEIVQIDKGFIKVKQGETETQIDLAPRKRAELTVLDPATVAARAATANNNGRANPTDAAALRRQRDMERFRGDSAKIAAEDMAAKEAAMKEAGGKGEKGGK